MSKIEVYTGPHCPYCERAKRLLKSKGIEFQEIDVSDAEVRRVMTNRSQGKQSIPQIFINDQHIGGCDDLYALDQAGKLDPLIAQ